MTDDELDRISDAHTLEWSLGPLAEHFDIHAVVHELRAFTSERLEYVPPVQIMAALVIHQKERP